MHNLPSCFRRGPGGGEPANRRSPLALFPGGPALRLYDRVAEVLPTRHYIRRTARAYTQWIRRLQLNHSF
jgi:hypothetical protein